MRATRAYIASLGTTGVLLASAGSLLLVVSALFAFNAWPGGQINDAFESLVVDEQDDSFRLSGPEQVALDASAAAVAVAPSPGTVPGGGAPPGAAGPQGSAPNGPNGPGGFEGTGVSGTDPGTPIGGDPPTTGPDLPPLRTGNVTDRAADRTQQATRTLGDTVGAVDPELGQAVSDTGQDLSKIVRDLPDVKVDSGSVTLGQ